MPRGKKAVKPVETAVVSTPVKTRKPFPSREERVTMAETTIARLEKLNASRKALIEKTEAKLNERKDALQKSEQQLEKAISRRAHLIAMNEKPAKSATARAKKSAEKKRLDELMSKLSEKGLSVDDLLSKLDN